MNADREAQWLRRRLNPLFLYFDASRRLKAFSGKPRDYGFDPTGVSGRPLEELMPELVGIDTRATGFFPLVTLGTGVTADIHLEPEYAGFMIVLVDARDERARLEKAQQAAHDSLLKARASLLMQNYLEDHNDSLQQESHAKSRFISGMSHEFRTPVMGMLGNIAWIRKELSLTEESKEKISAIESNAAYLLGLVDNLLEQGKISSNQLKIEKSNVQPRQMLHSLIATLLPLAEKRELALAHEIRFTDELQLYLDDYHLRRVLYNLVGNAIKFTDFGAVLLEAEYSEKQSALVIRITDTGIGIPPEQVEAVRQPFTRGENVGNRSGVGLGLAHASKIIEAMDGTLEIDSVLGEGTSVTLRIPAAAVSPGAGKGHVRPLASPGQVVLAEDSTEIAALYSFGFAEQGIPLGIVRNGVDLKKAISRDNPDLLLVDYFLGAENGLDLVRDIRGQGYDGHIILLTAAPDVDQRLTKKALQAGCNEVVQKPTEIVRLVRLVGSRINSVEETRGKSNLNDLLNEYIASFPEKRRHLNNELSRFLANPEDEAEIKRLKLRVHNISGSAGAYGFPALSEVAITLERVIDQYEAQRQPEIRRRLENACRDLISELEKHSARV
ncbi:MAG TPA: sensor histidine kinase [Gammaproteobacteria bacterium]|nr:sensor histidine kinase [Gammaproteobacteria bacterium]